MSEHDGCVVLVVTGETANHPNLINRFKKTTRS